MISLALDINIADSAILMSPSHAQIYLLQHLFLLPTMALQRFVACVTRPVSADHRAQLCSNLPDKSVCRRLLILMMNDKKDNGDDERDHPLLRDVSIASHSTKCLLGCARPICVLKPICVLILSTRQLRTWRFFVGAWEYLPWTAARGK